AKPWLIDRGFGLAQAGSLQIANLLLMAAGGAVLGIPLVRRVGNRRAVWLAGIAATAALGVAWLLETSGTRAHVWFYAGFGLQAVLEGALYVAIWALFMNWA